MVMDTRSLVAVLTRTSFEAAAINEHVQGRIQNPKNKVSPEEHRRTLEDLSWSLVVLSQLSGAMIAHAVEQEERLQAIEAILRRTTPETPPEAPPTDQGTSPGRIRRWLLRRLQSR